METMNQTSKAIERIKALAPHAEFHIHEWETSEITGRTTRFVFVVLDGPTVWDAKGTIALSETLLKNGEVRSRLARVQCRGFGGKDSVLTFTRKNGTWADVRTLASYTRHEDRA